MTDRIRKTLGDLKARQNASEHMPCPRNLLPLREWACFRPTQQSSDFNALTAEEIWKRVQDTQLPFLMNLYERWQDEHDYEDFNDYRAAAFERCPGLTALWAQPFRAEYTAADGKLVL